MKMGLISYPETSVRYYHHLLCNNPEERCSLLKYELFFVCVL